jgi:hypothetical protein
MKFNYYPDKDGICGLYGIRNKVTKTLYIGKHQDIVKRIKTHKYKLKNKEHDNERLQTDYNNYGLDNFEFFVLYKLPEGKRRVTNLNYLELYYIYKKYKGHDLYNVLNYLDMLLLIYIDCLLADGIPWENIKLRERLGRVLDILYKDKNGIRHCLTFKDPNDPRGWDQNTIKEHKKYCFDNNIDFSLVPFHRFPCDEDYKEQTQNFKVTLNKREVS